MHVDLNVTRQELAAQAWQHEYFIPSAVVISILLEEDEGAPECITRFSKCSLRCFGLTACTHIHQIHVLKWKRRFHAPTHIYQFWIDNWHKRPYDLLQHLCGEMLAHLLLLQAMPGSVSSSSSPGTKVSSLVHEKGESQRDTAPAAPIPLWRRLIVLRIALAIVVALGGLGWDLRHRNDSLNKQFSAKQGVHVSL
ncbi:hypothetical protein A0H81_14473 [Grifola frondosa]|uniref:Uncharacterized protein n=1 Tax=Grifola frondosa TaxID=5627 RepID=A0A1C7LLC7_GRIFR|nr:hypothetical protein A0H81_14473 [Grifola frondosa]